MGVPSAFATLASFLPAHAPVDLMNENPLTQPNLSLATAKDDSLVLINIVNIWNVNFWNAILMLASRRGLGEASSLTSASKCKLSLLMHVHQRCASGALQRMTVEMQKRTGESISHYQAKMEQLKRCEGFLLESQGQNLALSVLHVPYSPDCDILSSDPLNRGSSFSGAMCRFPDFLALVRQL